MSCLFSKPSLPVKTYLLLLIYAVKEELYLHCISVGVLTMSGAEFLPSFCPTAWAGAQVDLPLAPFTPQPFETINSRVLHWKSGPPQCAPELPAVLKCRAQDQMKGLQLFIAGEFNNQFIFIYQGICKWKQILWSCSFVSDYKMYDLHDICNAYAN